MAGKHKHLFRRKPIDKPHDPKIVLTLVEYSENAFAEKNITALDEVNFNDNEAVFWLNISAVHQEDVVEKIAGKFEFHPLVLEDILDVSQRPKLVEHNDYMHIILKAVSWQEAHCVSEQISVLIGTNYVITFQEGAQDHFALVREALRQGKGRIRKSGRGYLVYAMLNTLVESYFTVLENIGENIELLEERLLADSGPALLQEVHFLKTEMLLLRKFVWPLREIIAALTRAEFDLFTKSSLVYMRDIYDHTVQIMDTIDMYRDIISGLLELHLTSISNRLSEVMKVLTIISTIFIPLTFIAGLYGMNFKYMPELEWEWGYPVVICIMILISISMIRYFKLKKWL